ncbi:unnamed protein product [Linum tenue]|uniref:Uncharacterized protein n=1 Tax=Linum tenue TaxID=586396 RepID=A0AAV0QTL3_9ROSI|nr:unnamed protein product [Linum tenue]
MNMDPRYESETELGESRMQNDGVPDHESGAKDNVSDGEDDRLGSEYEEEAKESHKVLKGHSDVPVDEMLSDEYYEQDGEDPTDLGHYKGFSNSAGLNSRLQSKPAPVDNHLSRSSSALRNNRVDDNDDDADCEEEDEDDPEDTDFDPSYGGNSVCLGKKCPPSLLAVWDVARKYGLDDN